MPSKEIRTRLLWSILLIATGILVSVVIYKLEMYPRFNDSITPATLEMGSILVLMFFLIFVVLYVPTGRLKKGTKGEELDGGVEVVPMDKEDEEDTSENILFIGADNSSEVGEKEKDGGVMEALLVEEEE